MGESFQQGRFWGDLESPTLAPRIKTAAWMSSLVDLMTLILCFFVLLFALRSVNLEKWEVLRQAFRDTFAHQEQDIVVSEQPQDRLDAEKRVRPPLADGLRYLDSLFMRQLKNDDVWGVLKAKIDPQGRWLDYKLPAAFSVDDVHRLGRVMVRWDNPLRLVVKASAARAPEAMQRAGGVYQLLLAEGVMRLDGVMWEPLADEQVASAVVLRVMRGDKRD